MEPKQKTEEVIHSFLQKHEASNIEAIEAGTGIFKLSIHKAMKKLVESKRVIFNEEFKTYSPTAMNEEPKNSAKVEKATKQPVVKKADLKKKDEAVLIKEGGRDTSKYIFNKVAYAKSRLVLNLLKFHVAKNPKITLPILLTLFKDIKSRYGILVSTAEAAKIEQSSGRKRHFVAAEDLILIQGRKHACNSQWDSNNFQQFVSICKSMKYDIKKQQ